LAVSVPVAGGDVTVNSGSVIAKLGASQTSAGVFVGARTNNNLYLQTNNSTKLTVDTAGNVGIGTSAPTAKLNISDANPRIRIDNTNGRGLS
jgi:hypothetical protein